MRWVLAPVDQELAESLRSALGISPVLARLLVQRGLHDPGAAHTFLNPSIESLHPPDLLHGIASAVERLHAAIERREQILIYGDYDVDGTTATVILKTAIELCGGTATYHVPHRIRDGYGMKDDVIERAAEEGVKLVISVDTGIRAFAAAETAARVGIDLIVTDHHLPEAGAPLPRALAVINPNQPDCGYPCKYLCGAAVSFKLSQALLTRIKGQAEAKRLLPSFLKVVAIATIADAVPLLDENRIFAAIGLRELRRPVNKGLIALMQAAAVDPRKSLNAAAVGFRLAPRLNAAGRMDVAQDVIELFTCRDESRARELAAKLNTLNSGRQDEEQRILDAIQQRVEQDEDLKRRTLMVVDGDGWHRGVIGIAASRVVERYWRPALVVSRDENGEAHGSGRSIPCFHLLDALEDSRELFTRFGGHAHAVGFSLPSDRLPELQARLDDFARARLTDADLVPTLEIAAELAANELTPALWQELKRLEPFGMENREPVFTLRGARLLAPPRIMKERHAKLRLAAPDFKMGMDAVGWRMAEKIIPLNLAAGDCVDIAFRLDENDHQDFGGLQLLLTDVRRAAAAAV